MADKTGIEWTDATWNPIVGCSLVSPGCTNCYAMKMARRIEAMQDRAFDAVEARKRSPYAGLTHDSKAGAVWNGKVARASNATFAQPINWKRPRRVFVNSMGDLFHERVPDEWVLDALTVMAIARQHTFQILTKRSARMREFMGREDLLEDIYANWYSWSGGACEVERWPLPNVWLGVSAEDQKRADERIPDLLATPATARFVSAEPLLGPIDLTNIDDGLRGFVRLTFNALSGLAYDGENSLTGVLGQPDPRLDWIIVGGESGPHARPMHPDWARTTRDQCATAGVAYFHKQNGEYLSLADTPCDWWNAATDSQRGNQVFVEGSAMIRLGKAIAGRLLDGVEHNTFPKARQ